MGVSGKGWEEKCFVLCWIAFPVEMFMGKSVRCTMVYMNGCFLC
jgi:hypothetical protein